MKLKITIRRGLTWCLYFLFLLAVISCSKDDNYTKGLPTVSYVNFAKATDTIKEGGSKQITLKFSKPLEAKGSVNVNFLADSLSTAKISDFTTDPAIDAQLGYFTLELEKGATETSFTVKPKDNTLLNEEKIIAFSLSDATLGLRLAKEGLYKVISVPDDEVKQGDLTVSAEKLDDFGDVPTGEFSGSKKYTVAGQGLTADVNIKAPENFEVSLADTSFSDAVTVPMTDANAGPVDVYVRFAPKTALAQSLTGKIMNIAKGTYTKEVQVSGTEISAKVPPELIFEDNFEYGASSGDLTALSDWENYQGDNEKIQYYPDGLSFAKYPEEGGGSLELNNGSDSREDIKHDIPKTSSGAIYVAFLLKVSKADNETFFQSYRDADGGYFNRVYIKGTTDGFNLGIRRTASGGGSKTYTGKTYPYDKTIVVINKYDFDTQESSLYVIDGDLPAEEPEEPDALENTGKTPDNFADILFRQDKGNTSLRAGGVRVGPSWYDVVAP